MRYAVVIEKANGNYSAYIPDLPVASQLAKRSRPSNGISEARSVFISRG